MEDPADHLSTRVCALLAFLFFFPVVLSFGLFPHRWWIDYPGILFHLSMFLLVAKLDAPEWGKAAGYGWLFLDVTTGVMTLNGVPHAIADYVRFGGHIFAGIWLMTSSLRGSLPVKIVGVLVGAIMFGFSFLTPFLPLAVLGPTSILILIWLLMIAWQNGSRSSAVIRTTALPA